MSIFPPSFVEELRDRVNLSDVVGKHVQWDRRKTNPGRRDFWACCPFHSESSPSFHVDDNKGFYKCFGCGQGGNAITFLMEYEKRTFVEAVEDLAQMAGMPLPERTPEAVAQDDFNDRLRAANEAARNWFAAQLAGPKGDAARAYLVRRGIRADVADRWSLGFAPADRGGLGTHLSKLGFSRDEMVQSGLMIAPDDRPNDPPFDRFRDRLMFPICDGRGRVIAFGGRAMAADAQAKYLNSPETPLFHKGRTLFNLHQARRAAVEAGRVIVAEGYMDVIALVDAGIHEAVAPLGTALTEDQLQLLWKLAAEPILCLDGDKAGLAAAMRAMDRALPLLKPGQSLRFAMLPDGKDPDDLVRNDGPAAMEQVLAAARPLAELLWQRETEGGIPQTPERRAGLEARVLNVVRAIEDPAVRSHYQADMKARLRQMFEPVRAAWGGKPGMGVRQNRGLGKSKTGNYGKGFAGRGLVPGALPPTSSLLESALAKGGEPPHDRLMDLVFGICLTHIDLLVDNAERLAALEPRAPWRSRLRDGLIGGLGINHLDSGGLNDHLNTLGLANEVDALWQRVLANPEWAAARPGSDRPAAAVLLLRAFEAIEAGQGAGELALRAQRDALGGEIDADLADQISAARRDIEAARQSVQEEVAPVHDALMR